VDCEEQVLVRGRTDHVGQDQENWRCHGSVPEVVGHRDLQRDYSEDDPFCERFMAHELGDLYLDHQRLGSGVTYVRQRQTAGCFFIIAILLERWGSSVINQRKSIGSCGGLKLTPSSLAVGYVIFVLRGDLSSVRDSAPPQSEKSRNNYQ